RRVAGRSRPHCAAARGAASPASCRTSRQSSRSGPTPRHSLCGARPPCAPPVHATQQDTWSPVPLLRPLKVRSLQDTRGGSLGPGPERAPTRGQERVPTPARGQARERVPTQALEPAQTQVPEPAQTRVPERTPAPARAQEPIQVPVPARTPEPAPGQEPIQVP